MPRGGLRWGPHRTCHHACPNRTGRASAPFCVARHMPARQQYAHTTCAENGGPPRMGVRRRLVLNSHRLPPLRTASVSNQRRRHIEFRCLIFWKARGGCPVVEVAHSTSAARSCLGELLVGRLAAASGENAVGGYERRAVFTRGRRVSASERANSSTAASTGSRDP